MAQHNSTVAYGDWSFDLFFPSDMVYRFVVIIMITSSDGNYHPANMTEEVYLRKMTGYGLFFRGDSNPRINIVSYLGDNDPYIGGSDDYNLPSRLSGNHHFNITRKPDGQFYVYQNQDYNNPIISYKDTTTKSSEKFIFVSWLGATRIDNITVDDEVPNDNGTPAFTHFFVFISLITLVYFSR